MSLIQRHPIIFGGYPSRHRRSFMIYNLQVSLWSLVLTYPSSHLPITHHCVCTHTYTHVHTCKCTHANVHTCTHVHAHTHTPSTMLFPLPGRPASTCPLSHPLGEQPPTLQVQDQESHLCGGCSSPSLHFSLEPPPCGAKSHRNCSFTWKMTLHPKE